MDYKSYYSSTYTPNFEEHSLLIKEHFVKSKSRGKTFLAAREKLSKKYQEKISLYNSSLVRNSDLLQIFETRDQLYNGENIDTIEAILEDEVKDFFEDDSKSKNYPSYSHFLKELGKFKGIYDAKNFSGRISKLIEALYNEDKLNWLKELAFEEVKHYRDHSLFQNHKRYFENKIGDEDKEHKFSPTPDINVNPEYQEIENKINLLTNDEKILILSVLNSLSTKDRIEIPATEIVRIHYICEGVFSNEIFLQESNSLIYMRKFSKGIYYYNRKKQLELKNSTLRKLDPLPLTKFKKIFEESM